MVVIPSVLAAQFGVFLNEPVDFFGASSFESSNGIVSTFPLRGHVLRCLLVVQPLHDRYPDSYERRQQAHEQGCAGVQDRVG
jgi:hypothetical protein